MIPVRSSSVWSKAGGRTSDRRQSLDKATAKSSKSAKHGSEMSSAQSNRCQRFHKGLASEMSMDTKSNKLLVTAKPCHSYALAKIGSSEFRGC